MKLDPVTLEILNNKVTALTEEMCLTLQHTGRTLYVKETADFCCALAGLDGRFFAYPNGMGVSGFVGLECLSTIQAVGVLVPGDVILTNDPYRSHGLATHLTDIQAIEPYFHEGEIVAYGWAFLHASDVGGNVPSSITPRNASIFQEGLQIPPVKILQAGAWNDSVLAFLNANSRTADANFGDIKAMLAALAKGRQRIAQIVASHGARTLLDAQDDLMDYTATRAAAVLRKIPEGTYRFEDFLDDEAGRRYPIRIAVELERHGDEIRLDFTHTDPQVDAALNIASDGRVHAWLTLRILAFICTFDRNIPLNAGLLRGIRLISRPGSIVYALYPAAVGVRHATAVRVNDVLNGALGLALPGDLPAASGGTIIPIVVSEPGQGGGTPNVQVVEPLVGGTGAMQGADGVDGRDSSISNLGNNPVETVEAELNVEVLKYQLRPDSGGAGQWRGGCGQTISFRIGADNSLVLARGMERMTFRPWAAMGGSPGASTSAWLSRGTADQQALGAIDTLPVNAGDIVTLHSPGGGGWGDPFQRAPEAVAWDHRNGLVSTTAARDLYGVSLDDTGRIDIDATRRLRDAKAPRAAHRLDTGPERRRWDEVFDRSRIDQLNELIFQFPQGQRVPHRSKVYADVLAQLPDGFPRQDATNAQLVQARKALHEQIAALQVALGRLHTL